MFIVMNSEAQHSEKKKLEGGLLLVIWSKNIYLKMNCLCKGSMAQTGLNEILEVYCDCDTGYV